MDRQLEARNIPALRFYAEHLRNEAQRSKQALMESGLVDSFEGLEDLSANYSANYMIFLQYGQIDVPRCIPRAENSQQDHTHHRKGPCRRRHQPTRTTTGIRATRHSPGEN